MLPDMAYMDPMGTVYCTLYVIMLLKTFLEMGMTFSHLWPKISKKEKYPNL